MPLRFDQPKVLGEWEGDPTVIHQALAKMGQGGDMLATGLRENRKLDIEAKKKPSFKISEAASPFSVGQKDIGERVNRMLNPSVTQEEKEFLNQQNIQQSSLDKAQKNTLEQFEKQVNEYQQGYGADVWDFEPIISLKNKAYVDDDSETRELSIQKMAENINNPAKMFKPDVYFAKKMLAIDPQTVEYSDKDEKGIVNTESKRRSTSRLFVPDIDRPEFEYINGKKTPKIDGNGNPVYELRPPRTVDEILPDVRTAFNSDKKVASWATEQAMNTNSTEIEKQVNSWAENETTINNGVPPSKELIEARKQIVARDIAENTVANNWLALNKPISSSSNTRNLDEQTQAEKDRAYNKSWGANGSYDSTFTSGDNSEKRNTVFVVDGKRTQGDIKTYGELGIARKDKNGEPKAVIIRTDKGAWNASRGKYIQQGLEMNVGGLVVMAVDKKTGFPKPTNKTPDQLKKEGVDFGLFVEGKMVLGKENKAIKKEDIPDWERYVALNNKEYLSTDNEGVDEQQEFNKLEAKFAKQGQSSYVMKKLDNNITNQLAGKDVNGFLNLNNENKKLKQELDRLNKSTGESVVSQPKTEVVQPKTTTTRVKGVEVPMAKPKVTTIKKADIAAKAKAAGYSVAEYTELLRGNGITIE